MPEFRSATRSLRLTFVGVLIAGAAPLLAQPAMSRGQQFFQFNPAECLNRAAQALRNVGFSAGSSGNFAQGFREQSGAYILCNDAPGGGTVVNIVVATNTNDAGVPGNLRQQLQAQMNHPSAPPPPTNTCAGAPNTMPGAWTYQEGSFTDYLTLNVDGTGVSRDGKNPNRWSVDRNQLVVRWNNGWTNTLQLPGANGVLSGTAAGPAGQRLNIRYTRECGR